MKIVFFASSHFALESLKALIDRGYEISCCVTQPDKKAGRGMAFTSTAIKQLALKNKLKVFQPAQINSAESVSFLKNLGADLFVIIAYGQILSQEVLAIPKIMAVNIHASLLPKYRGAAPINWAIIKGEKQTGLTIFKLIKKMDAGPIIDQREINIDKSDTSLTLESKLSRLAASLLLESLEKIMDKKYSLTSQDEDKVSFAPKLKKIDGLIDWNKKAADIHNQVKGCLGWPGAFTYYRGKILKIYETAVNIIVAEKENDLAGRILQASKEGIVVITGEGSLVLKELQLEGKRRMRIDEFIAGHKILAGEAFNKK